MMNDVTTVALTKLCLWYDAGRIQTWPSLLAQIDPNRTWPSPTALAREYLSDRMTDLRHVPSVDMVRCFPGLEYIAGKLVLKGVGLIEKQGCGYALSETAQMIGSLYRDAPHHRDWVIELARVLLRSEPRTRILARLLGNPSARLVFDGPTWFGGHIAKARLCGFGQDVTPFATDDTEKALSLRPFIDDEAWWALGQWRDHELLAATETCRFVGKVKNAYTLDRIAVSLRPSMEVLAHLGIMVHEAGEVWLDSGVAADLLGPALAEDFGWELSSCAAATLIDHIRELLPTLQADTGLVVASELRRELVYRGIEDPDREIGKLMDERKLILERTDHGQPRHGEGLFGEPQKQLIKIRVLGGHHHD